MKYKSAAFTIECELVTLGLITREEGNEALRGKARAIINREIERAVARIEAERDEADRRAGAAERKLANLLED